MRDATAMAASRSSASSTRNPPTAPSVPRCAPSRTSTVPSFTTTVRASAGSPSGRPGRHAGRLVQRGVVGVHLRLLVLRQRVPLGRAGQGSGALVDHQSRTAPCVLLLGVCAPPMSDAEEQM